MYINSDFKDTIFNNVIFLADYVRLNAKLFDARTYFIIKLRLSILIGFENVLVAHQNVDPNLHHHTHHHDVTLISLRLISLLYIHTHTCKQSSNESFRVHRKSSTIISQNRC